MNLDAGAAVLAGLVAGVVMLAVRMAMRTAGIHLRMDVVRMWATFFRLAGTTGFTVGLAMHLLVSAGVGLVYALGLHYVFAATDALWLWGVLGGVIHYVIAGGFLAVAPDLNPEMPERIPAPGPYATRLGPRDVLGFLVSHLSYGLTWGVAYGLLHPGGGAAVVT